MTWLYEQIPDLEAALSLIYHPYKPIWPSVAGKALPAPGDSISETE